MPQPILWSLDCEEALTASLLLHDESRALDYFTDDEVWFGHLRPVLGMVRRLHALGKPYGPVFVLHALQAEHRLDELEWRGDSAEVMLADLLSRRMFDPQAWYGPALGLQVHSLAEERKRRERAQVAALQAFASTAQQAIPASGRGFLSD
jgi:hypothetical protein